VAATGGLDVPKFSLALCNIFKRRYSSESNSFLVKMFK
jgi:hypothetical protein